MKQIQAHLPAALWTLLALALGVVALANFGRAFVFPLELEAREGTSWLHVLALQAGVPLYDHTRVAFLNMNHGPLDPILKSWLHALLPFLTPAMVTRFFVLLLPFGLFLALHRALRAHAVAAAACTGALYLFLLGLAPPHLLIGRSDPAALFFLALMLPAGDAAVHCSAGWVARLWRVALVGALAATAFLINWRFLPVAGLVTIGWAIEGIAAHPGRRSAWAAANAGGFIAGFLVIFLTVLLGVFHGDFPLYFRHFFGFFVPDSGWSATPGPAFSLFPPELRTGRWVMHGLLAVLLCLAPVLPGARLRRSLQLGAWLPVLASLWVTLTAAYFLNQAGGGLYYLAPFYIVTAWHLARVLDWTGLRSTAFRLALPLCLLGAVPWQSTWQQAQKLDGMMQPARDFLAAKRRLTGGHPIHSEDLYLFETSYAGETIDMGDVVYQASPLGYYGPEFEQTAGRYFAALKANPPEFVMLGTGITVVSPPLFELVIGSYTEILHAPPHLLGNHGASAALFQRRPPGLPGPGVK